MRRFLPRRPSAAALIASAALFLALGGTGYAALHLPKNSVGTKQLKKNAVTSNKIKNGSVTASKINANGLTVPNANHANSADSATHASSADSATNANDLGGAPASAYETRPQWALVKSDGTILTQSGGITVNATDASTGRYFLDFGTSLANRPVSLVLHFDDGGLETGSASATPCGDSSVPGGFDCTAISGFTGGNANHLFVRTTDNSGGSAPFGFYVTVGN